MSLRVIGGEYRGRKLASLPGRQTRPLLGQVREALFNILADSIPGAEVWDLFAGTGANGIEALSRGAARVLFLEKSNSALRVLRANLDAVDQDGDVKERCHVVRVDAWDPPALRPEGEGEERAPDVVFFDPPYAVVAEDPVKAAARAHGIADRTSDGGVLCFHFPDGCLDVDDFDERFEVDLRRWGSSAIALISRRT